MKKHFEKLKNKFPKKLPSLKISKLNFSSIRIPLLSLMIGLILGFLLTSQGLIPNPNQIGKEKTKTLVQSYLTSVGVKNFTISEVVPEGDLYAVKLTVEGFDYTSYASKDGKLLFPQALELTKTNNELSTNTQAPSTSNEIPKSDKPQVDLFVMSHCPYGTQAMKGMLPAQNALGDKIDFNIKFVSYAMHGEIEVNEQLSQYCIQKELGRDVLSNYLSCFLDSGESEKCLNDTKISKNSIQSCIASADKEFSITASLNDKSTWNGSYPPFNTHKDENIKYNVQGSPTLVINGVQAESQRDSKSYLDTICSSFNTMPDECKTELDSTPPSPGFGSSKTSTTGSTVASANTNAQCL